ncbi:PAS domain-containing protein [Desertibaculum subflavum]|uniref:PAS domain-containing protein n=1 Tax=Desertibaculum subflavum TaxID=2268458 RepID=UPI000E65EE0B
MDESEPRPRHAALHRLYAYWQAKRGGAFAPSRTAIDPAEIRDLLPFVVLADVVGTPPRFRIRLAGTHVVEAYGEEVTGRYADELDFNGIGPEVLAALQAVVRSGRPGLVRRDFVKQDGRPLRYERLVLPLSSDGVTVDKLFGGAVLEQLTEPPAGVTPAISP